MHKLDSVAVVIPCFNASKTIAHAIESVLSQDRVDLNILVIDDGSSDDSIDIVHRFGSVISVLTGPHTGVSLARNRGIAQSSGDWIVFLDADDLLLPETLKKRLDTAGETGADVIVCDWQDITDSGEGDGQVKSLDLSMPADDAEIACATHAWATTAALMYRRALVEKIGGFRDDLPVIQDARFLFDAAYHRARFAHSPHVGARYRVRSESLSRRDPAAFWRDVLRNAQQIQALWEARGRLSPKQVDALFVIFDHAARGLFAAAHPQYFDAVDHQRSLGRSPTRHGRFAPPLARALGLSRARRLLRVIGR